MFYIVASKFILVSEKIPSIEPRGSPLSNCPTLAAWSHHKGTFSYMVAKENGHACETRAVLCRISQG